MMLCLQTFQSLSYVNLKRDWSEKTNRDHTLTGAYLESVKFTQLFLLEKTSLQTSLQTALHTHKQKGLHDPEFYI